MPVLRSQNIVDLSSPGNRISINFFGDVSLDVRFRAMNFMISGHKQSIVFPPFGL